MPARDDFEMEFENEAEVLVSGIEAAPGGVRLDPEDEEVRMLMIFIFQETFIILFLAGV